MRKYIFLATSLFLLGIFAQGCSNNKNSESESESIELSYNDEEEPEPEPEPEPAASFGASDEEGNYESGYSQNRRALSVANEVAESQSESPTKGQNYSVDYSKNLPVGRKLEKKARICIQSSDITRCRKFTDSLSSRYGAYVEKEQYASAGTQSYNIKLRVPSASLDSFLSGMHGINGTITEKSVSVNDRTAEYRDNESRRKTQEAMLERYRTMLRNTTNISDMLEVQSRIDQIQMETDRVQGRMNVIDHNVSYSLVYIIIDQERKEEPIQTVEEEKPSFWKDMGEAFCTGWDIIKAIVLGIITIWPLWILVGVIVYIWRKKRKNKPVQDQKKLF